MLKNQDFEHAYVSFVLCI